MIEIKNIKVMNFENAVRGARNPMNSWDKIDSSFENDNVVLGENDLQLLTKLCKAGSDHRKFMRQIFVSVDITAPLYWWKEMDTYKVGTTANSTSTMHKLHTKDIVIEDFSIDNITKVDISIFRLYILYINSLRRKYIKTKDMSIWHRLIQLLPSNYNQTRTFTCTYENLINIYYARRNHKLKEWVKFCEWISTLPYTKNLILDIKE